MADFTVRIDISHDALISAGAGRSSCAIFTLDQSHKVCFIYEVQEVHILRLAVAVNEDIEGVAALGIGAGTQTAIAANALAASGIALGAAGAGVAAVAGVDAMYKAKNAYADPPMASRGQYSGNLGMFANQQVHFIVAIRHTIRPENELDLIGYPSGKSGKIGDFSGFLKSSAVYLADGFIGSVQERNEILEMIAKGIYV